MILKILSVCEVSCTYLFRLVFHHSSYMLVLACQIEVAIRFHQEVVGDKLLVVLDMVC